MNDFEKYVAQTSDHSIEFEVESAEGVVLTNTKGEKFIDLNSGVGVMNLGHANKVVTALTKSQLEKYSHTMVYGEHIQAPQVSYAKMLSGAFSTLTHEYTLESKNEEYTDPQVFFVNSGNEAIDLALKLVKKITGKSGLVSMVKGFHGRGSGPLQVTWNEDYRRPFMIDCSETDFIDPFAEDIQNELDKVEWSSKAAVFIELVQGEGGARALPQEFVKALRKRTFEENVFLVVDEVQTGFGRTGELFAQTLYGVTADITCLGKAGGGGLPFGAVVAPRSVHETLLDPPLSHISTFGGNPVVCAAGEGVLLQLTRGFLEGVRERAEYFERSILQLINEYPTVFSSLSGVGFLRGLTLNPEQNTETFYWKCVGHGILPHFKLNAGKTLRMSPPLTITVEEIDQAVKALRDVAEELK